MSDDDKKVDKGTQRAYEERLKHLRRGQEFANANQFSKAVESYILYLSALAAYHGCSEEDLSPDLFDGDADTTELLLISHVYWDLARAYDRSPTMNQESVRCLGQFTSFSVGFKYQHVNAQMVGQYLKRGLCHNMSAFKTCHDKIKVGSKGCFVATHCFGVFHPITDELRAFRRKLLLKNYGPLLVEAYYQTSPHLVTFLERIKTIDRLLISPIIRTILTWIAAASKRNDNTNESD